MDKPGFIPSRPLGVKGTISRKEIYDYLDDPTRHPYLAGKEPAQEKTREGDELNAAGAKSFAKDWNNEKDAQYDDWKKHYNKGEDGKNSQS